jgi:hypothetical protein
VTRGTTDTDTGCWLCIVVIAVFFSCLDTRLRRLEDVREGMRETYEVFDGFLEDPVILPWLGGMSHY